MMATIFGNLKEKPAIASAAALKILFVPAKLISSSFHSKHLIHYMQRTLKNSKEESLVFCKPPIY